MRLYALFLLLLLSTQLFGQKSDVLYVEFEIKGQSINASWHFNLDSSTYRVSDNSTSTLRMLNYLRNTLVYKQSPSDSIVAALSNQFFGSINEQIRSANYLNFIIDDTLLIYPLDLLEYDGVPLFINKKIYYSFNELTFNNYQLTATSSGLILRDATADPENGCGLVNQLYEGSTSYDITDLNLSNFEKFDRPDFFLISAHGMISDIHNGYIAMNQEAILPAHIASVNSDLIYFDSCNLGISKSFISAAQQSGTKFLLAPIVKNQAGNSSTLTIKYFFEHLKSGLHPIDALYLARKSVYKQFDHPSHIQNLLWYSFPFRIYALN
jgi:hypothetical protein